jgi:thiol-disulfide isomerase/thioredoxin
MMEKTGRDWYSIFLSAISLALAVLVILLVLQNRDLKQKLRAAAEGGGPSGLAVGETLSPFTLVDAAGAPAPVPVGNGQPRLVLLFTSTCPHCSDAMPIWRDLVRDGGGGMEVVGVQLDAGRETAKPIDTLPFPVLAPGETPPQFLSKVTGVPATILLDGSGKIEKLIYGPPLGDNKEALRVALAKAVRARG